jgi:hypothetical protein
VWEWVLDWYDVYPGGNPNASNSFGDTYRVSRGGSWYYSSSVLRSAYRGRLSPDSTEFDSGFRCALSELEEQAFVRNEEPQATTTSTPLPVTIFYDDFTENLDKWEAWENRTIENIATAEIILGELLDLKGSNYDKVGATALQPITLSPGLVIDFEAETANILDVSLFFDWYPGDETRPATSLGSISLEISPTEATLYYQYEGIDGRCSAPLPSDDMRLYRLEFRSDWRVTVYSDIDGLQEICSVTIDNPEELTGRITFSGWGLVDKIFITQEFGH